MDATQWLLDWFKQQNPNADITEESHYIDGGAIDSFGMIELIESVETQFSIQFAESDFQDPSLFTVKGLAAGIRAKQAA